MSADFEIRQIFASVPSQMRVAEELLSSAGLRPDVPPYFIGAYDASGILAGVGGIDNGIIKCVAVRPEARGTSITNILASHLMSKAQEEGHTNVFVFTKPEYANVFTSLSFHIVGQSTNAILLESDPRGIKRYTSYLQALPHGEKNGVIVMNCNPLTLGHLHLIKKAAAEVDRLFIIPVMEDKSLFSYDERHLMLIKATSLFDNVTICRGSRYSISSATFPTYFIKELSKAAETQIELDCDIFSRHIIPALDASVRFVGTEPTDALTQHYNQLMARLLPIKVKTIERMCDGDTPISASKVRQAIATGKASDIFKIVPATTIPYILAEAATTALMQELELTPKPGLVDLHDNGAHTDMSADLMRISIAALRPWLGEIASNATKSDSAENIVADIRRLGMEAEKSMLCSTHGVNTHKGALFCMGLTIAAAAQCYEKWGKITTISLRTGIKNLASLFTQPERTHGFGVTKKFGVGGALASAQSGYEKLFTSWLPFLRTNIEKEERSYLLLLKIMSELDDTNIYHRCGAETAENVKLEAEAMLENFSLEAMANLNSRYISLNISPGGAADMLALTLLIYSITQ